MTSLSDIDQIIEVTPWDDVWYYNEEGKKELFTNNPFRFRVLGRLEDGQVFYGLYGTVIEGDSRYLDLTCNIMVRSDGSDWTSSQDCSANFVVGSQKAQRNHGYDFRHPSGIVVEGFPRMGRFGRIEVVDSGYPRSEEFDETYDAKWNESGLVRTKPPQPN